MQDQPNEGVSSVEDTPLIAVVYDPKTGLPELSADEKAAGVEKITLMVVALNILPPLIGLGLAYGVHSLNSTK